MVEIKWATILVCKIIVDDLFYFSDTLMEED